MNAREKWVTGVRLLREYLTDDYVLARALRERRWSDLLAAAELANNGIDHEYAVTDPILYKNIRDATTKYFMRGYGCLHVPLLREQAEKQSVD